LVVLKPGGGGAPGSQYAIRAKPDGYTLMLGGSGPNTIFALVQNAPIGPDHFTSIARINYSPAVFAVKAEAPWKSFREVVDYMKKNPGKFNFANTGTWGAGDFPMRMVGRAAGVEYNNIPYDGCGSALLAVLGGNADGSFLFTAQLLPQIAAGKMRALAVTDMRRHRDLPNVPTVREEGVDVVFTQWRSGVGRKGGVPGVAEKVGGGLKKVTEGGSVQGVIKKMGRRDQVQSGKEYEGTLE